MMAAGSIASLIGLVALTVAFTAGAGCGGTVHHVGGGSDGGDDGDGICVSYVPCSSNGGGASSSGSWPPLTTDAGTPVWSPPGLCPSGILSTTISGHVYDPANLNPVYNATVFVPHSQPQPFPSGTVCSCSSLFPIIDAVAQTDASGYFKIQNTPSSGPNGGPVPLVVQMGKWRMQATVKVTACQDNPVPEHTLRLPKNHTEGDIPQIAISTGAADSLECLLMRMGLDASEYVAGAGTSGGGHIHIFTGVGGVGGAALQGGVAYDPAQWLWDKDADINHYDAVLFSCEGGETAHINVAGQQVILDYANNGGRVFASHFHYALFDTGPFDTASGSRLASWTTGAATDNNPIYGSVVTTLPNGKPFPEGVAFGAWLGDAGALTNGKLPIQYAGDNAVLGAADVYSQAWLTADSSSLVPGGPQYFSFDTPFSSGGTCDGRVVYSDLHATGGPDNTSDPNTDYPGFSPGIVPSGCTPHPLTPQEKALEFMLFDLTACRIPIGQALPPLPTPM
jgi:hypothetical protein